MHEMKEIPGFSGYYATADGRIWTTKRKGGNARAAGVRGEPRPMKLHTEKRWGYVCVSLDVDGKVYRKPIHQLILMAFAGPCPPGKETCHYPDSTPSNNAVANLRWGTHRENIVDKTRHRIGATRKICSRCSVPKSTSDFYHDKRALDGRTSECKQCHSHGVKL